MTIRHIEAVANEKYMFVNVSKNDKNEVNATVVARQQLRRIEIGFILNIQTPDSATFSNFINKTVDLCSFLRYPLLDPLVTLFYDGVKANPHNKIFESCPIEKVYPFGLETNNI